GRDFFFSSRRRHTRFSRDWSSDVCSSDLPAHPAPAASLHNLATLLDVREQYRTAEQLFARALAIRQEVYGEEHVDTASTLHNLVGVLDAMGDSAQAEPMYRRDIAVWEKLVGVEHPATATSINNLADLLREKGEYAEA